MPLEVVDLIVPISAGHVSESLAIAREDQEAFWLSERAWLENNNLLFWRQTCETFADITKSDGLTSAEAARAGRMLGHHSVRVCLGDDETSYRQASTNYQANLELDDLRLKQPGTRKPKAWDKEGILLKVFNDQDLVDVLLNIKSDRSRHSTAVTLGLFCLKRLPELD